MTLINFDTDLDRLGVGRATLDQLAVMEPPEEPEIPEPDPELEPEVEPLPEPVPEPPEQPDDPVVPEDHILSVEVGPNVVLYQGDCLVVMKTLPDNSVDSIVTDPPYGLSKEPKVEEVLTHWLAGDDYIQRGGGFMGKTWDSFVPGPSVWKEALRVLKPGGHLICFAGSRTVDLMGMAIRMGGFEIRDQIQWLYGSGFPKSMNVAKAVESHLTLGKSNPPALRVTEQAGDGESYTVVGRNNGLMPVSDTRGTPRVFDRKVYEPGLPLAEEWDGWGTALKPAHEPIILARKPFKTTVAVNVLEHGTGALNIAGTRIATADHLSGGAYAKDGSERHDGAENWRYKRDGGAGEYVQPEGRWPANVILTHHGECVEVGTKQVKAIKGGRTANITDSHVYGAGRGIGSTGKNVMTPDEARGDPGYGDEDGMETVEAWECHEDCPVRMLDEQTGILKSGVPGTMRLGENTGAAYGAESRPPGTPMTGFGDSGGASRFYYTAKASRSERNAGLDEFATGESIGPMAGRGEPGLKCKVCGKWKVSGSPCVCVEPEWEQSSFERPQVANNHPTVKPLALMRYLVRLVTPPDGLVLDPYLGSGTTGIAAVQEGHFFIGIEIDDTDGYLAIAEARIKHWVAG